MSKKTIVRGTLLLTITGFATRLLGFYNRIFLNRLIGVTELGIYQLIFPIYIFSYAVCAQGIALSLIKNIAYYSGKGDRAACHKLFGYSVLITSMLGCFITSLIMIFANPISIYIIHNPSTAPLLRIIALALPFVSVKTCFNSYFVGLNMPFIQGTSHFFEQMVRIITSYILYIFFFQIFAGARIAVIAVVSGEILSSAYSFVYFLVKTKGDIAGEKRKKHDNNRKLLCSLIKDAVPISINSISLTFLAAIEAILLPAMLVRYYSVSDDALYMYGVISGIVMPFILFPSTITNSLSTMLMPSVSSAYATSDAGKIEKARNNTICFCSALGIASWLCFLLFGELACRITFNNDVAGELLSSIGFICPIIYLCNALSSILTGIGKTYTNLLYNLIAIVIRLFIIAYYVPTHGIYAYIFAIVISYSLQDILMIITSNRMEFPDTHNN